MDSAKFETTLNERIDKNWPTLANVAYAKQTFGSHWIVVVGRMHDGNHLMNDPGTNSGNGAATQSDENIIQKTKRQGGYSIVRLCLFKVI